MLGGLLCLCVAASACHRESPKKVEVPLPNPMQGWKVIFQTSYKDVRRVTFAPIGQPVGKEKMWAVIVSDPPFRTSSTQELIEKFRPTLVCDKRDLNVLRKDYGDMLFEEHDTGCHNRPHSLTLARITRSVHSVSYLAYHANVEELPPDKKDNLIKYMNSAPLETSKGQEPSAASTSAMQEASSPVATPAP